MNSNNIFGLFYNFITFFVLGFCFYFIYNNLFVTLIFAVVGWYLIRIVNYYGGADK